MNILQNREELIGVVDEKDGDETFAFGLEAIFHGRHLSSEACISIGSRSEAQQLRIKSALNIQQRLLFPENFSNRDEPLIEIKFQGKTQEIPVSSFLPTPRVPYRKLRDDESEYPPAIYCKSLGPSLLGNADIARFWDKVTLTNDETLAVQALQLIYGEEVERVAVVGNDAPRSIGRRAIVKMKGQEHPVPLKSLGDGAVRLFGTALALANSRDGFLVIDEAENGIHHSVQPDFWKMVMKTAHENNVQVLSTTHGWDCIAGFAQAATDSQEVYGVLVRLERDDDRIRAVEYSEDNLKAAAEYGIEVR